MCSVRPHLVLYPALDFLDACRRREGTFAPRGALGRLASRATKAHFGDLRHFTHHRDCSRKRRRCVSIKQTSFGAPGNAADTPSSEFQFSGGGLSNQSYLSFIAALQHPLSRGSIHINSSNPSVHPIIDPKCESGPRPPPPRQISKASCTQISPTLPTHSSSPRAWLSFASSSPPPPSPQSSAAS